MKHEEVIGIQVYPLPSTLYFAFYNYNLLTFTFGQIFFGCMFVRDIHG